MIPHVLHFWEHDYVQLFKQYLLLWIRLIFLNNRITKNLINLKKSKVKILLIELNSTNCLQHFFSYFCAKRRTYNVITKSNSQIST